MISNLIRLGVKTTLKLICEKIIIKHINIINKNNKFNGVIDELNIKAESIIFKKINISNININIKNITARLPINNRNLFIDNCYADIYMKLTIDNINKTLLNKRWNRL